MKGLAFYETAAQIIPVLLLVAVIEMRLFGFTAYPYARLHRGSQLFFVVLGEWRALRVLQTEDPSRLDAIFTWLALLALAIAIIAYVLAQLFSEHVRPDHPSQRRRDRLSE